MQVHVVCTWSALMSRGGGGIHGLCPLSSVAGASDMWNK
jgi:hypothetical protein